MYLLQTFPRFRNACLQYRSPWWRYLLGQGKFLPSRMMYKYNLIGSPQMRFYFMFLFLLNYINNLNYKISFAFQPGVQKFSVSFFRKVFWTHSPRGPGWKQGKHTHRHIKGFCDIKMHKVHGFNLLAKPINFYLGLPLTSFFTRFPIQGQLRTTNE